MDTIVFEAQPTVEDEAADVVGANGRVYRREVPFLGRPSRCREQASPRPFLHVRHPNEGSDIGDAVRQVVRSRERLEADEVSGSFLGDEAAVNGRTGQHGLIQTRWRERLFKCGCPSTGNDLVEQSSKSGLVGFSEPF